MSADYTPILMLFLFAVFLAAAFVIISAFLGKYGVKKTNLAPYECGIDQATVPRQPISVKFFVVALMFLLFDVEIAVLYPWATLFKKFVANGLGQFVLIEGLVFIGVLAVGLVYIFRVGVLDWEK